MGLLGVSEIRHEVGSKWQLILKTESSSSLMVQRGTTIIITISPCLKVYYSTGYRFKSCVLKVIEKKEEAESAICPINMRAHFWMQAASVCPIGRGKINARENKISQWKGQGH